jgi:formamidopyrimidine-DNA glycosylase
MPELPEVERERRKAQKALAGRRIVHVNAADDSIVFAGVKPRAFARALTGRRVRAIHRKGKYLWFELDRPPSPVMHFGMGGHFEVYTRAADRPRYWKMELIVDNGARLAMTNARRLGRIRLVNDPEREPPIGLLGFDPLLEMPSLKTFAALLTRRKAPIKVVLLDQTFSAGVGNWIADEVLYQAGLAPMRVASDLTAGEISRLRTTLRRVVRKAVAVDADKDRFPAGWLFHHRWGRNADATTAAGEKIEHMIVGGRTTAWAPSRQR